MARTSELEAAYRATTYRVFLPEGACDLRVGVVSVPLRCWLQAAGIRRFAILTAFNPHSCLLPAADNALRQARLHRELLVQGYSFEVGETWPPMTAGRPRRLAWSRIFQWLPLSPSPGVTGRTRSSTALLRALPGFAGAAPRLE